MNSECCFICGQIAGDPGRDLLSRLLGDERYERRVAFESTSFTVIPSVGPIVAGHALLCPRSHFWAMRDLPACIWEEFEAVKDHVIHCLEERFGVGVHCFEHGSASGTERLICSVGHAHMHFLPVNVDVLPMLGHGIHWRRVGRGVGNLRKGAGRREYLYYESPDRVPMVAVSEDATFESQYLRRVFATALGRSDRWNWREDPRPEDVHFTFLALRETLLRSSCGCAFGNRALPGNSRVEVSGRVRRAGGKPVNTGLG